MKTVGIILQLSSIILLTVHVSNGEWLPKVVLPEKIIVGYASWDQCDEKLVQAAMDGVNVLIWFSIDLLHNYTTAKPYINRGPDPNCVAQTAKKLKDLNLETIHLISIGGWNALHPDPTNTAEQIFIEWKRWNSEVMANSELQFSGYDGIDWDIEGTDDVANERNHFKVEALDLMGKVSQLMKQDGYIVAMAPAESYLDPSTSSFDRSLRHTYSEWDPIVPNFSYRGRNTYGYLLSRYGTTVVGNNENGLQITKETFDFVTIQLYEGYSHCLYNTSRLNQPTQDYIQNIVEAFNRGWIVEFSTDPELFWNTARVQVPPSRLVIGLANGWADNSKFLLLNSTEVGWGYKYLEGKGLAPKGFGFWDIYDEGRSTYRGDVVWLAKELNEIMNIRNSSQKYGVGSLCLLLCGLLIFRYFKIC